jgi:dTDP-4-amino-4,6-dideoxygalactose transaminase
MDAIKQIADRFELAVIEDACQAHGAQYFSKKEDKWKKTGSMGIAAAFSFYPGKNLGACGEGGAVTTNDELIANRVRMMRDHGQAKKYYHDMEGYNGRLDAIQAGFLGIKLKNLVAWNEKRRHNASLYTDSLGTFGKGITPPFVPDWAKPVYHLYISRVPQREKLQKYLNENGVGTGLHYPVPIHLQKAYAGKGYKEGDYSVTEKVAQEILSLPMFPELIEEQIRFVINKIKECYAK